MSIDLNNSNNLSKCYSLKYCNTVLKSDFCELVGFSSFLTGCSKKTNVDTDGKLLSEEYAEIFKEEIKNNKDILDIAKTISKNENIKFKA